MLTMMVAGKSLAELTVVSVSQSGSTYVNFPEQTSPGSPLSQVHFNVVALQTPFPLQTPGFRGFQP